MEASASVSKSASPDVGGGEAKGDDGAFETVEVVARADGRRVMRVTREFLVDPDCPGDRLLCGDDDVARQLLVPPRFRVYMDRFVHEAERSLWSSLDVDVAADRASIVAMMASGDRQKVKVCELLRKIHGWFAFSEDLIQECVIESQRARCTIPEELAWLAMQDANEVTHKISYQTVLMALIPDATERKATLAAVKNSPALKAKQDWMRKYTNPANNTQLELRVAAACSEAIFFMCSFTAIFAVKPLGAFPGICHLNDYISRDETRHADQHAYLVRELVEPVMTPTQRDAFHAMARDRVQSAVEAEFVFVDDLLPEPLPLIGLASGLVKQYVQYVGDCILSKFKVPPMFNAENPFPFMKLIDMVGRENFHDLSEKTTEYQKMRASGADIGTIEFGGAY